MGGSQKMPCKRDLNYSRPILDEVRRLIYVPVGKGWHDDKQKKKESGRVKKMLCRYIWEFKCIEKPIMIPVVVIKIKAFIKENCPVYTKRLLENNIKKE